VKFISWISDFIFFDDFKIEKKTWFVWQTSKWEIFIVVWQNQNIPFSLWILDYECMLCSL